MLEDKIDDLEKKLKNLAVPTNSSCRFCSSCGGAYPNYGGAIQSHHDKVVGTTKNGEHYEY